MTKLEYTGPAPGQGLLPLPEGWPPFDHDEPDTRAAALKIQSGLYRPAPGADQPADGEAARRGRGPKQSDTLKEA